MSRGSDAEWRRRSTAGSDRPHRICREPLDSSRGCSVKPPPISMAIAADVEASRYRAKPSRVFRFEDIREAHRVMEANEAGGKMVVVHD